MKVHVAHLVGTVALFACAACSGSDKESNGTPDPEPMTDPGAVTDGCERGKLEEDLTSTPMTGPSVVDGKLEEPGGAGYVVSSTFLRLPAGEAALTRFQELVSPIIAGLPTRPGLRGFQLGLSAQCNVARTLSIWASEEAMYEFVSSDEHMTAVAAVGEVSRGASVVVHWSAENAAEASWEEAAPHLAASKGPFY